MNTKIRSIATRVILIGGLAGSAMAIVPGVASAGLASCHDGQVIQVTKNDTTIYGTGCADIIKLSQFTNVTVYAGGGNDTIHAGFAPLGGKNYVYGEGGNDRVIQLNNARVWFSGGAGNDSLQGSTGDDVFYGNSGTDTFYGAMPGDFYDGVEVFA